MHLNGDVFYFAYGSNMSSKVFKYGFRQLRPSSEERAILRGYRLTFTEPGIPFFEPAFANVEEHESAVCEGVLYRITAEEMDVLDRSEGGRAYKIIEVEVKGGKSGTVKALTFQTREPAEGLIPSKRYIDILLDGAKEHDLSKDWIEMLEALDHVDRTNLRHVAVNITRFNRFIVRQGLPHPFRWWKRYQIRKTARRRARR
jgi:cation transport regulator ChaC